MIGLDKYKKYLNKLIGYQIDNSNELILSYQLIEDLENGLSLSHLYIFTDKNIYSGYISLYDLKNLKYFRAINKIETKNTHITAYSNSEIFLCNLWKEV